MRFPFFFERVVLSLVGFFDGLMSFGLDISALGACTAVYFSLKFDRFISVFLNLVAGNEWPS